MAGSFERARQEELPDWLADEQGLAFEGVRGKAQDDELALLKGGVLARTLAGAPDDALDYIGAGFDEPRFVEESNDHYRARLADVWEWKAMLGERRAIEIAVRSFCDSLDPNVAADVRLLEDWQWSAMLGDFYSRIYLVIGPAMPSQWQPRRTPFKTNGGEAAGCTAKVSHVREVKRQILRRKAPHAYPVSVILAFDSAFVQGLPGSSTPFVTSGRIARWPIGRFFGVNRSCTPFRLGGYDA